MTRRASFDGTCQAQALRSHLTWSRRALRTRSGKTLRDLARELSMSQATLGRYLAGATPLGSDQFAIFAAAFETTEAALVAACFPHVVELAATAPLTVDPPAYDFLAELRRALPHNQGRAEQTYAEWGWAPESVQRALVAAFARLGQREDYKIRPTGT